MIKLHLDKPACLYCGKPVFNWDPECPPFMQVCDECTEGEAASRPHTTFSDRLIVRLLETLFHSKSRHINTKGFDPYSGEVFELKRGRVKIEISNLVANTAHIWIGRREFFFSEYCGNKLVFRFLMILLHAFNADYDETMYTNCYDGYGCPEMYE